MKHAIFFIFLIMLNSNAGANEVIHGDKRVTIKKMIHTGSGNINIKDGSNNIRIFSPLAISKDDLNIIVNISNLESLKKDYSLSFLSKVNPEKFKHNELSNFINKFNSLENEKWRLPTFDELDDVSNNEEILSKYLDLEVWTESENGNPSFYKLDLGQRLSGNEWPNKKRYLLLVRDILGENL